MNNLNELKAELNALKKNGNKKPDKGYVENVQPIPLTKKEKKENKRNNPNLNGFIKTIYLREVVDEKYQMSYAQLKYIQSLIKKQIGRVKFSVNQHYKHMNKFEAAKFIELLQVGYYDFKFEYGDGSKIKHFTKPIINTQSNQPVYKPRNT